MIAAEYGHKETVEILLQSNASVNTRTNEGSTALMNAARTGHEEIDAFPGFLHEKSDYSDYQYGIQMNYKVIVESLLEHNADINAKDNDGMTALILAAWYGNKDIVEILLKNNAEINARGKDDSTALHVAALWRHKDIVEILLQHGADINALRVKVV